MNRTCGPRVMPQRAHPLIQLVFDEWQRQKQTALEITGRAELGYRTLEKWRAGQIPSVVNLEAVLNVLGFELRAVPVHDERATGQQPDCQRAA